ncbi:putative cytosolic protein [Granulibacter bethesdensis]|uniref:Cytosolic protein n=1 Tax=Granulibacter bethesdensis TaxID=364410 RepID=A0AAC9K984_9PROT|nr:hypothetical protein [Granulibacter bethesdensis]APH53879.1 putative cytosolic protein [Granulibacter bethesdensis]APH61457.1 putative cytosolic protein [Granulibacter bethesdensis]
MLDIRTFDNRQGGNVLYKALAHPLAAEAASRLTRQLAGKGEVAVFDPEGIARTLFVMLPELPPVEALYVQDTERLQEPDVRPVTDLPRSGAKIVLVATFDTMRLADRLESLMPEGAELVTLADIRIPEALQTAPRYLDRLNFATNFAFFRDQNGLSTRLVTANYWAGYGANSVRLWLRLFAQDGSVLATWEQPVPAGPGGIVIDSREVRARFNLPEFTGQLFIHAIGVAGHDVVKYAVDTYGGDSLSCTHDANAWPSERYAGLPAPREDERVILWVQNSHAVPIPAGAIALDRMGAEKPVALDRVIPPFATEALDVAALLPGLHWPAQVEILAGRHVVRPRYEVIRGALTRIAHPNVERADLRPDPGIRTLSPLLGRGYLLPFPILPRRYFRSIAQPTPMAHEQNSLPLRLDLFTPDGKKVAEHFLGNLPRHHGLALDLDTILPEDALPEGGHGELVYDFREGGEADGWLHGLFRYEHRVSGHAAETSFGAHIYNTAMTYRGEPQSYSGPPPGLSTRLFLKLGSDGLESFAHLIYPASAPWRTLSRTSLLLYDAEGKVIAEESLAIPCSGSHVVRPHRIFGPTLMEVAGRGGYVLIRDRTCRLFGYHGLERADAFSLDHMFGF